MTSISRIQTEAGPAEIVASAVAPPRRWPRWLKPLLLGLLFIGTVLLMRRPTPHRVFHTLPANTGDPALVAWIMSWDVHALLTHPSHLFNAPIFWPRTLTLAYSDLLLPVAPLFGLLHTLTGSYVAALNLTVLVLMVFTQIATYALAKRLTGRDDAAILAAIAFTFSGYALAHWGHPQLQLLGLLPLGFLVLFRVLDVPTTRNAVICGVVTAAIALGALYYGALFALCAVAVVLGHAWSQRYQLKQGFWRAIAISVIVAGGIVLPFAVGYWRLQSQDGFQRPAVPAWGLKADDLLTPAPRSYLYDWMARIGPARDGEHMQFQGFVVMALGAIGLVSTLRRREDHTWRDDVQDRDEPINARRHRELRLLVLAAGVSIVVAIGPEVYGITAPFGLLRDHVPGFGGIRVAARLAVVAWLALAVLAGKGFAVLTRHVRSTMRGALAVGVGLVILVELAAPVITAEVSSRDSTLDVYRALDDRGTDPVVELPMMDPITQPYEWAIVESPRMLFATTDWHPRVNGYSGYLPPGYAEDVQLLNTFPAPSAVARLQALGVRYVVLHLGVGQYTPQQIADIVAALPPGATARPHGDAWLVDLRAPPEPEAAADGTP
ncbi:MAG TPA: hypothetical protein VMK16_04495 [Acidimicrobiales bacterium]|nr:hypothetical protein [Acidimicrobiales bacterium]